MQGGCQGREEEGQKKRGKKNPSCTALHLDFIGPCDSLFFHAADNGGGHAQVLKGLYGGRHVLALDLDVKALPRLLDLFIIYCFRSLG